MTQDRLSRLQKWILTHALTNNNMLDKRTVYAEFFGEDERIERRSIYRDTKTQRRKQACSVVLSNSLRRLKEKGLITYTNLKNTHRLGKIRLTSEGRERAVEIK